MTTIPAPLTRNARVVQRALIAAIFFVSFIQFLVHDPTSSGQEYHARSVESFYDNGRSKSIASSLSLATIQNNSSLRIISAAGANRTVVISSNNPDGENTAIRLQHKIYESGRASDSDSNTNESSNPLLPARVTDEGPAKDNPGEFVFCGSCSHNKVNTCNERVKYMMGKYQLSEAKAREDLMPKCGIDPANEPYVLLHAGPHKTGTTAIQSFLYQSLWHNASFLQKDNFAIPSYDDLPGVFGDFGPMLNFAHCMISDFVKGGGQMNVAMCNKLRRAFPPFLEKRYDQSHHVLLVAEDLDRIAIDHTRIQYYLKPYRRFRVVVAYRRLHDWLPSWYNQIVQLYLGVYLHGEAPFPNLVEWIDTQYEHFIQVHAIETANRFRNSGKYESVDIINMHDGIPLLENIFCNVAPFANATCQAVLAGAKSPKPNIGRSHEYERLATKAFLRKKIKDFHKVIAPKVANEIMYSAVERGLFRDADDYPKICVNQTFLDRLLRTEMEQERRYFPTWYDLQGGEEGLRKSFENAKHKFCSMDDEKILDSGILDPIFEELNK